MTIKEDLIAARRLIVDPTHWLQHKNAINGNGELVPFFNTKETDCAAYCANGALGKVCDNMLYYQRAAAVLDSVARLLHRKSFISVNDGEDGHKHILQVFDLAIAVFNAAETGECHVA